MPGSRDAIFYGKLEHPLLGTVFAASSGMKLVRVSFGIPADEFRARLDEEFRAPLFPRPEAVTDALTQLREYLDGTRTAFDLPLDISRLTGFRQRVLQETVKIPYGETVTYGELARRAGSPRAARAVGGAMAANPIPLVIPCHRVLASGGRLHGYSGGREGLPVKARLLALEGVKVAGERVLA